MQGGNLINLRRRGSGSVGSSAAQGEWEHWPEEGAAGTAGQSNEDDEMQRAIAASLADPDQGLRLLLLLRSCQQHSCLAMMY